MINICSICPYHGTVLSTLNDVPKWNFSPTTVRMPCTETYSVVVEDALLNSTTLFSPGRTEKKNRNYNLVLLPCVHLNHVFIASMLYHARHLASFVFWIKVSFVLHCIWFPVHNLALVENVFWSRHNIALINFMGFLCPVLEKQDVDITQICQNCCISCVPHIGKLVWRKSKICNSWVYVFH